MSLTDKSAPRRMTSTTERTDNASSCDASISNEGLNQGGGQTSPATKGSALVVPSVGTASSELSVLQTARAPLADVDAVVSHSCSSDAGVGTLSEVTDGCNDNHTASVVTSTKVCRVKTTKKDVASSKNPRVRQSDSRFSRNDPIDSYTENDSVPQLKTPSFRWSEKKQAANKAGSSASKINSEIMNTTIDDKYFHTNTDTRDEQTKLSATQSKTEWIQSATVVMESTDAANESGMSGDGRASFSSGMEREKNTASNSQLPSHATEDQPSSSVVDNDASIDRLRPGAHAIPGTRDNEAISSSHRSLLTSTDVVDNSYRTNSTEILEIHATLVHADEDGIVERAEVSPSHVVMASRLHLRWGINFSDRRVQVGLAILALAIIGLSVSLALALGNGATNSDSNDQSVAPNESVGTPMWVQIGSDIDGPAAEDEFGRRGVSLSGNGERVAIGAPFHDSSNGKNSGLVQVYEDRGGSWVQLGLDMIGDAADDEFGHRVSLSYGGTRVAIGANRNSDNGFQRGKVKVYEYFLAEDLWSQVGDDIYGEAEGDTFGWSLSLSLDGGILAVGADWNDGRTGLNSGHVRVFHLEGNKWTQLGGDIDGESGGDESGESVSISADGWRVAIGAYYNSDNGPRSGHARVFNYDGSEWQQLGQDLDGEEAGDHCGTSVSLSTDGARVAVGAPFHSGSTGTWSGHARVYEYDEDAARWQQLGSGIDGESPNSLAGSSVSLSGDGTLLVVGSPFHNGNGDQSGQARVFVYNGTSWVQLGDGIYGEAPGDHLGSAAVISANGNRVAVGASQNSNNGKASGHVRIFERRTA